MHPVPSPGQIELQAPGPGTWILDKVHVPRPFSRFQAEIHPPNLAAGFRMGARRYGMLIDTLDWRMVSGFAYFSVPPAPQAEIPERFQAAEDAIAGRIWRDDMTRWEQEVKPAAITAHLELQRVDPATLDRDALLSHLDRCREHQQRMIQQHHEFSIPAMLSIGDFMAQVSEWTGLPLGEFLALVRGAAPESAGSFPQLDRLVEAIRGSAEAQGLLKSDTPDGELLDRLANMSGAVGVATLAYLEIVGYRLLDSLDLGSPYAFEVPGVLVSGIRSAVENGPPASSVVSEEEIARVRDRVPAARRETFDELLGEARLMSRLRDERGLYSEVWAGGITRRAILAAGDRAVREGRLAMAAHLVEGTYAEIRAFIAGGGPSADELARRAEFRATHDSDDVPPFLGPAPEPPPSLDGLPPAVARVMRAVGTAIEALFAGSTAESEATIIRGIGASPGTYQGTARLVQGPADFDRLQQGDVLITSTTTESFNIVLPLLGAIVTNSGGLLSHAAIVSREFGIPSVVGCRDATALIPDGAQVTVDGTVGEVVLQSR